jgi:hypothetical protein
MADVSLAAFGGTDPVAFRPRRVVADVLLVAAFEVGYPVGLWISVEADNFARDACGLG